MKPADDCISCHMPRRPAKDGGHTAFTDHRIQRKATLGTTEFRISSKLVPWREPPASLATRNLGLAYLTVGERDRSASQMDEANRLLIEAQRAYPQDPAVLTGLGLLALRQRKTADALPLFTKALEADPSYAPYQVNLATAMKEAGRTDEAIALLRRAISLDPSLEVAYRRLGEIMRERRKPDEMRAVFESYLKFMPNNVTVRIALQNQ